MTKSYLAQVQIPHDDTLARDAVVNTFSFLGPDIPLEADRSKLKTMLTSFYTDTHTPGSQALYTFMSKGVQPSLTRLKLYRRDDVLPRAPVFDESLVIPNSTNDPLPHEVAVVLSFRANFLSGVPRARSRGRIYFGPLATNALDAQAFDGRPTAGLMNALAGAGAYLMSPAIADNPWTWVVHSELAGDATVVAGFVDNAFDTQRRRGVRTSARTVF